MYTSIATASWAKKSSHPYLVTPNGMLNPWAMKTSKYKKFLAWHCYERSLIEKAACLQANTISEAQGIRAMGFDNPICIIPNGINIPKKPAASTDQDGRLTFTFLGRKHPKKGLAELIEGFALGTSRNDRSKSKARLIIAGSDYDHYEVKLKRLAAALGLVTADNLSEYSNIVFMGPVYDRLKEALFRETDVFVLPSLSEGQPIAALEALASAIPAMLTPQCNLPEALTEKAVIEILPTAESIASGLDKFIAMPEAEIFEMGQRGRKLVRDRFSWEKVTDEIESVYHWMIGNNQPPNSLMG
jgi:poly(glycerol-phosphate) alpha-glucosyltransferase